jgi:hypothetical protein
MNRLDGDELVNAGFEDGHEELWRLCLLRLGADGLDEVEEELRAHRLNPEGERWLVQAAGVDVNDPAELGNAELVSDMMDEVGEHRVGKWTTGNGGSRPSRTIQSRARMSRNEAYRRAS